MMAVIRVSSALSSRWKDAGLPPLNLLECEIFQVLLVPHIKVAKGAFIYDASCYTDISGLSSNQLISLPNYSYGFNERIRKNRICKRRCMMGFDKHLFISYAHLDNQSFPPEQEGWITRFHASLEQFLSMHLGRKTEIWRDKKLQGNDIFAAEIVA